MPTPTIVQIQAAIDAKSDARQIINMIADYLQANPGGGGGLTIYSGDGSLAADRTVDLNGKILGFIQAAQQLLTLDVNGYDSLIQANTDANATSYLELQGNVGLGRVSFYLQSNDGNGNQVNIEGEAIDKELIYTADKHIFIGITEFADNAAAITGGLAVGTHYRTGDNLKIVH